MSTWSNVGAVARREYTVRVRTRSFVFGTALLVIGVAVIAMLPVIIRVLDRMDQTRIAVAAETQQLASTASVTLDRLLNAPVDGATDDDRPAFVISIVADGTTARDDVNAGDYGAALVIDRAATGELDFVLFTNDSATGRTATLIRQAANAVAIADRLDRAGVAPADQATLFAPAEFGVRSPDPEAAEPPADAVAAASQDLLGFGMTILIFMIIIMYGNWIAMSVVEEKSSRVMEVVLNAATPFQLLAGKVLGVGAVAFTQYGAVVVSGLVSLALIDPVGSLVLGEDPSALSLPTGLTPEVLLAFGVYGVLGFLLYASLYAAAGSLVSRQEDVNAAVMPMTFLSMGGYLVGVYASIGLLDVGSDAITVLSVIPFFSPFMMLGQIAVGAAAPWEIVVSLALLVASILVAVWIAARIYAAGVLLYGQRPGARTVWRLLREGIPRRGSGRRASAAGRERGKQNQRGRHAEGRVEPRPADDAVGRSRPGPEPARVHRQRQAVPVPDGEHQQRKQDPGVPAAAQAADSTSLAQGRQLPGQARDRLVRGERPVREPFRDARLLDERVHQPG
jgi:ABC-2 type transport system permease protein